MNKNLINEITSAQLKTNVPAFRSGDTVKVAVRIVENGKSRNQMYEGVVTQRRGSGIGETFTVRKMSSGVGVERTWAVNSPVLASIEIVKKGKVRRNKIHYLRNLRGKQARIKTIVK
jgi:large subunit ribosomal protein L19